MYTMYTNVCIICICIGQPFQHNNFYNLCMYIGKTENMGRSYMINQKVKALELIMEQNRNGNGYMIW